jgi:hypothetical protein
MAAVAAMEEVAVATAIVPVVVVSAAPGLAVGKTAATAVVIAVVIPSGLAARAGVAAAAATAEAEELCSTSTPDLVRLVQDCADSRTVASGGLLVAVPFASARLMTRLGLLGLVLELLGFRCSVR